MKPLSLFLPLLLISCGVVPLYETGTTVVSFYSGFEENHITNTPWNIEASRADSVLLVANPARSGSQAVKFTIYPEDYVHSGSRSEISYNNADPYLSEAWYGWSFMMDSDYTDSGDWQLFGQWHDQPDYSQGETWDYFPSNSPPLGVIYTNGMIALSVLYSDTNLYPIPKLTINKGEWIDLVFHIKWSVKENGFVEAWVNGEKWCDKIYAPTLFNKAGNYFKIGIYRGPDAAATNSVYYDEVRIGNSYDEVVPR